MTHTDIFICSQWQRFMQTLRLMRIRDALGQHRALLSAEQIVHELKGAAVHCELAGNEGADDIIFIAQFASFLLLQHTQAQAVPA